MEFDQGNQKIRLQGDPAPETPLVSFNALAFDNMLDGVFEIQFWPMSHDGEPKPSLLLEQESGPSPYSVLQCPSELRPLLQEYQHLFRPPQGLSPHRAIDHRIHLLPNTALVNVRPYGYPQFQKLEMARLVSNMLAQGTIRPSRSPFSSPVLLVRKKMEPIVSALIIGL